MISNSKKINTVGYILHRNNRDKYIDLIKNSSTTEMLNAR
jgi:hypothetical protein